MTAAADKPATQTRPTRGTGVFLPVSQLFGQYSASSSKPDTGDRPANKIHSRRALVAPAAQSSRDASVSMTAPSSKTETLSGFTRQQLQRSQSAARAATQSRTSGHAQSLKAPVKRSSSGNSSSNSSSGCASGTGSRFTVSRVSIAIDRCSMSSNPHRSLQVSAARASTPAAPVSQHETMTTSSPVSMCGPGTSSSSSSSDVGQSSPQVAAEVSTLTATTLLQSTSAGCVLGLMSNGLQHVQQHQQHSSPSQQHQQPPPSSHATTTTSGNTLSYINLSIPAQLSALSSTNTEAVSSTAVFAVSGRYAATGSGVPVVTRQGISIPRPQRTSSTSGSTVQMSPSSTYSAVDTLDNSSGHMATQWVVGVPTDADTMLLGSSCLPIYKGMLTAADSFTHRAVFDAAAGGPAASAAAAGTAGMVGMAVQLPMVQQQQQQQPVVPAPKYYNSSSSNVHGSSPVDSALNETSPPVGGLGAGPMVDPSNSSWRSPTVIAGEQQQLQQQQVLLSTSTGSGTLLGSSYNSNRDTLLHQSSTATAEAAGSFSATAQQQLEVIEQELGQLLQLRQQLTASTAAAAGTCTSASAAGLNGGQVHFTPAAIAATGAGTWPINSSGHWEEKATSMMLSASNSTLFSELSRLSVVDDTMSFPLEGYFELHNVALTNNMTHNPASSMSGGSAASCHGVPSCGVVQVSQAIDAFALQPAASTAALHPCPVMTAPTLMSHAPMYSSGLAVCAMPSHFLLSEGPAAEGVTGGASQQQHTYVQLAHSKLEQLVAIQQKQIALQQELLSMLPS